MQPSKPVTKCPHCGGESGYLTAIVMSAQRSYSWNGVDDDTDNYTIKAETNPRCADCGKSVRAVFRKDGRTTL